MSQRRTSPPQPPPQEPESRPDPSDESGPDGGAGALVQRPPFPGLSARQCQAVEALLREPTLTRAAATVGVTDRTLRRWLKRDRFRDAVLAARREAFGQAVGLSQRYAPVAVATLVKVMQDQAVNPGARVTAAVMLLRFGRDGIELDDLVQRLEALERSAWGGHGPVVDGKLKDQLKEKQP